MLNAIRPIKSNIADLLRPFVNNDINPWDLIIKPQISSDDFTNIISLFKINTTFKTTANHRHSVSNDYLVELIGNDEIILDIGASDGITSLNLIEKLNFRFKSYYVTDLNLNIKYARSKNKLFLFDKNDKLFMMCTKSLICYPNNSKIIDIWANYNWNKYKKKVKKETITLIQPELKNQEHKHIFVKEHDAFEAWEYDKPTVIKVANVFNRSYFEDHKIVTGIRAVKKTLQDNGILVVIDNRGEKEKSSFFRKNHDRFELIHSTNGGTEILSLILNHDS